MAWLAIHFHHSVCRLFQFAYWKDVCRNASAVARTSHRNGQCWPSTKLPPARLGRLRQWQIPPETIPYLKLKSHILPKPLIPKKVRRKKSWKKKNLLFSWLDGTKQHCAQCSTPHREITSRQGGTPSEKLAGESGLSFSKAFDFGSKNIQNNSIPVTGAK